MNSDSEEESGLIQFATIQTILAPGVVGYQCFSTNLTLYKYIETRARISRRGLPQILSLRLIINLFDALGTSGGIGNNL